MKRSDSIVELATALSKAQAQFGAVRKTGTNPMFKSSYATFDDIIGAVRAPLSEAGLSYMQMLDEHAGLPALTTTLMHGSGEWIESTVPLVSISGNRGTNEVQAFGSALTYMKRYALASMLGVASDEDDDGNLARTRPQRPTQPAQPRQAKQEKSVPDAPADEPIAAHHWIDDATTRKRFWAWAAEKGLNDDDIHTALGVAHIRDFDGDKAAAVVAINIWLSEQPLTEG